MRCMQALTWRVVAAAGWVMLMAGCARRPAEVKVRAVEPQYVEIAIATPRLAESLPFYQGLGFTVVNQTDRPQPSARLTDGVLMLDLLQGVFASPQLHYYKPRPGPEGQEPAANDPSGQAGAVPLVVYHFPLPGLIANADAVSTCKLCRFSEISIYTGNLKQSLDYWQKMGFKTVLTSETPYPWAVLSDASITLGLHQKPGGGQPALTYTAADMAARIAALKKAGYAFTHEILNEYGKVGSAELLGPEGQRFLLQEQ